MSQAAHARTAPAGEPKFSGEICLDRALYIWRLVEAPDVDAARELRLTLDPASETP